MYLQLLTSELALVFNACFRAMCRAVLPQSSLTDTSTPSSVKNLENNNYKYSEIN